MKCLVYYQTKSRTKIFLEFKTFFCLSLIHFTIINIPFFILKKINKIQLFLFDSLSPVSLFSPFICFGSSRPDLLLVKLKPVKIKLIFSLLFICFLLNSNPYLSSFNLLFSSNETQKIPNIFFNLQRLRRIVRFVNSFQSTSANRRQSILQKKETNLQAHFLAELLAASSRTRRLVRDFEAEAS